MYIIRKTKIIIVFQMPFRQFGISNHMWEFVLYLINITYVIDLSNADFQLIRNDSIEPRMIPIAYFMEIELIFYHKFRVEHEKKREYVRERKERI